MKQKARRGAGLRVALSDCLRLASPAQAESGEAETKKRERAGFGDLRLPQCSHQTHSPLDECSVNHQPRSTVVSFGDVPPAEYESA
jgi:hypothetical protein